MGLTDTPEAASVRSGFRSGRALVLNFTVPCPPLTPGVDCAGVWLGFGECEANGTQLLRFATEVDATPGGRRCRHLEGETKRRPC